MKGYRIRYQRKKEKKLQLLHNKEAGAPETEDDEDDLISEYAPSELSAIIAAEENGGDDYTDGGSDEVWPFCLFMESVFIFYLG